MDQWSTSYAPQGAFFTRDAATGGIDGLTPQGQTGAFKGLGGALAGVGKGMMTQQPGQPPQNPAMMFAQGMQSTADAQRRAAQPGQPQQMSPLAMLIKQYGQQGQA